MDRNSARPSGLGCAHQDETAEVVRAVVDWYTARHAEHPGRGYAEKAARWGERLGNNADRGP